MKAIAAIILFLLPLSALGKDDIDCPEGTIISGETTPEVREAWCEINLKGKTVLHGPYRAWYPNGKLGTSGHYDKGKPVGTWYGWYESGARQGEEVFVDGKKVSSKYWEEKGKPKESLEYNHSFKKMDAAKSRRAP